jgi:hypothetical protein
MMALIEVCPFSLFSLENEPSILTHHLSLTLALSLRIPLSQIQSTTYAFYPDETHNSIRRVFIPQHAPETKRHFCGFCGTHLTTWSEINREEADWVCVSVASLKNESLERLDDAGFLSAREDIESDVLQVGHHQHAEQDDDIGHGHGFQRELVKGASWFDDMIKGSPLGRIRRRVTTATAGGRTSSDGRSRVEWEIVEFQEGDDGGDHDDEGDGNQIQGTGKRKFAEDTEMNG